MPPPLRLAGRPNYLSKFMYNLRSSRIVSLSSVTARWASSAVPYSTSAFPFERPFSSVNIFTYLTSPAYFMWSFKVCQDVL